MLFRLVDTKLHLSDWLAIHPDYLQQTTTSHDGGEARVGLVTSSEGFFLWEGSENEEPGSGV